VKRAVVLGGADLRAPLHALGLSDGVDHPDVVLIDADDDAAVGEAGHYPPSTARIFVAGAARSALLRAAGIASVVTRPFSTSALGLALLQVERGRERGPRAMLFAAASGATGRTSLVANIALRIAGRAPVVAIDATGSGALAWRLNLAVAPWPDITGVGMDLTEGHLRLAAAEREGALFLGGVGSVSSGELARVVSVASGFATVLIDAPPVGVLEPVLLDGADRLYVCANPDPVSAAACAAACGPLFDRGAYLVVSQAQEEDATRLTEAFGRAPAFILPRDEPSFRRSIRRRGPADGRLGRAYDAIAEIVLADVAE
jgi:hypothetical protein